VNNWADNCQDDMSVNKENVRKSFMDYVLNVKLFARHMNNLC